MVLEPGSDWIQAKCVQPLNPDGSLPCQPVDPNNFCWAWSTEFGYVARKRADTTRQTGDRNQKS